jgi:hypothetical protein
MKGIGCKFMKTRRHTVLAEIFERSKKKETSVPGPHDYNPSSWKSQSKIGKTKGISRIISPIISCLEEHANNNPNSPMLKYETIEVNKIK